MTEKSQRRYPTLIGALARRCPSLSWTYRRASRLVRTSRFGRPAVVCTSVGMSDADRSCDKIKQGCVRHPSGEPQRYDSPSRVGGFALGFFKQKLDAMAGLDAPKDGAKRRASLHEVADSCKVMMKRAKHPLDTTTAVLEEMRRTIPWSVKAMFRMMGHGGRMAFEANAALTPFISEWLVGPCERIEGEITKPGSSKPELWRSTVKIERCAFLESSGCKTVCVHMCKLPTQGIFTEMGLPLTMEPNFSDMSCTMRFGQAAPPLEEDPGAPELCYSKCAQTGDNIEDLALNIPPDVAATRPSSTRTCTRSDLRGKAPVTLEYAS